MNSDEMKEVVKNLEVEFQVRGDELHVLRHRLDCLLKVTKHFGGDTFDIDADDVIHIRNARMSFVVDQEGFESILPATHFKHLFVHWCEHDGPQSIWAYHHIGYKRYADKHDKMIAFSERVYHEVYGKKRPTFGFFTVDPGTESFVVSGEGGPNLGGW